MRRPTRRSLSRAIPSRCLRQACPFWAKGGAASFSISSTNRTRLCTTPPVLIVLSDAVSQWHVTWDMIEPAANYRSRIGGAEVTWDLLSLETVSPRNDRTIWLFIHTLEPGTLHRLPMHFDPPAELNERSEALILLAGFQLEQPPILEREIGGNPEALMQVTVFDRKYWIGPQAVSS